MINTTNAFILVDFPSCSSQYHVSGSQPDMALLLIMPISVVRIVERLAIAQCRKNQPALANVVRKFWGLYFVTWDFP